MHKLKKIYISIKNSEKWETNKFLILMYPLAILFAKVLWLIRRAIRRLYVSTVLILIKLLKKVRKYDINLVIASTALRNRNWQNARKYYNKIIRYDENRYNFDPETKNIARINVAVLDNLINLNSTKKQIKNYLKAKKNPKIVIYTAIVGGYDTLKLPNFLDPNFDYVLFTDLPIKNYGVFDVRPIPYFHEDPTRQARFVKTHPHELLNDYEIAVWIDANVMILGNIEAMVKKFINSKKPVAAIPHPLRNSIYEEGEECLKRSKDDSALIKSQLEHYRLLGFDCNDLIESNLMMFDLKNKKLPDFFATWWEEIDKYSRRDQLSLNYSLRKAHIDWHMLMNRPTNMRNHNLFALVPHHAKQEAILELQDSLSSRVTVPYGSRSFADERNKLLSDKLITKKTIDIVYCVHNALDDVIVCLDSVLRNHSINERLIIIDDGSDSKTKDYLQKFYNQNKDWVLLNRKSTGSGYTKAANRGLRLSKADLVILLNSDTIVTKDWTAKMAHAVFSTAGAGIVGPLSSAASHQSIPNYKSSKNQTATNELPSGITVDEMNDYCERWSPANYYPRVPLVHGFCFGITKETLARIGYFDENNFSKGYGEENDYCFRAVNAGIGLVLATNTYIYHAKSKSYKSADRLKLMEQGNKTLAVLHGKDRIKQAILTMQRNPLLEDIRSKASHLYKTKVR